MGGELSRYVALYPSDGEDIGYDARRMAAYALDPSEMEELHSARDSPGTGLPSALAPLAEAAGEAPGSLVSALNRRRAARRHLPPGRFANLRLSLTERCNMACHYCFQRELFVDDQPRMSAEMLDETLCWFIKQASGAEVTVQYFGGEPLMEWPLMVAGDTILRDAADKGVIAGFRQTVTTNGTLVTPDRAQWMFDQGFDLIFSFDGPPEVNDSQRVMRNGTGSFDRAMRGLRNWVTVGGEACILMTATPMNVARLPEHAAWFIDECEIDIGTIGLNSPQPTTGGWEVGGAQLARTVHALWMLCRDRGVAFHGPGTFIPQHLRSGVPQLASCVDADRFGSGPGAWPLYVSADGRASLCLVHHNDRRVLVDRTSESARAQASVWHRGHDTPISCDDCAAVTVCGGPCALERVLWGERLQQDRCEFMRTLLPLVVRAG